jgi:ribosomal protein L14E/L6E/L27E
MIGKFATSKAGHDKDQMYVIVAADREFVYLCDGRLKTYDRPKKKRLKHIQIINKTVREELLNKLINHEKIMDEEIRYAIKHAEEPFL